MTVAEIITQKVSQALDLQHLDVINESHRHSVPPGSESHFKLVIVSDEFAGQTLVRRHQAINGILAEELRGPIHALSLQTFTPSEWQARGGTVAESPDCLGGSKADAKA